MLGPVWFTLPGGREVQPFAVAPWSGDPAETLETIPPILRTLRGDFPCVPFGATAIPHDLPKHWLRDVDMTVTPADDFAHGFGANHSWELDSVTDDGIVVFIEYPETHPVRRVSRRIAPIGGPGLSIELTIEMRRDAELPIGLHPIFALPDQPGGARLEIPSLRRVRTFPVPVEPGSILLPDQDTGALTGLAALDDRMLDLTRLPLDARTEELLSVLPEEGKAILVREDQGYAVTLDWDVDAFPHCLLWLSNAGRDAYPWKGRFRALGIEPVCSAFDLGHAVSASPSSPFATDGVPTLARLSAKQPFRTRYSIRISSGSDVVSGSVPAST
jgi:hypothetical protein